jgi:hypothetical protein
MASVKAFDAAMKAVDDGTDVGSGNEVKGGSGVDSAGDSWL